MVVHKRTKLSRNRGTKTHKWGSKKKRRGAGSRGGRGLAGTGKRGDQLKTRVWEKKYFGKSGFTYKGKNEVNPINIDELEKLCLSGKIKMEGDSYIVNLKDIGYDKLLGSGRITVKLKITADHASKKAIDKVKEKGGEVILPTLEK